MSNGHDPLTQKLSGNSQRVKEVRRQLALSQEELAHALGVSFATANRWENGKTVPSKLAQRQFKQFCAQKKTGGAEHGDHKDAATHQAFFQPLLRHRLLRRANAGSQPQGAAGLRSQS
ncbi:MAG: helix-turn-helix transcriptional regulator [Desulfobacterales bacterium]